MSDASGGSVAVTDLAGAEATFTFFGTGAPWQTVRGPDQGRAQVFVDGALLKTVDNYMDTMTVVVRSIDGLAVGEHEFKIVVLGEARPASDGTEVSIDRFTVLP